MKRLRDRRTRRLAALIVVGLLAGMTGGTYAAFSATTSDTGNSFGVKADYEAPTVVRSEIARTTATAGGRIKANVAYYVFAQITDGGNPASGVNTANANVCNITTATCGSVALVSGSYTMSGLAYNYRSASKTSDVGLDGRLEDLHRHDRRRRRQLERRRQLQRGRRRDGARRLERPGDEHVRRYGRQGRDRRHAHVHVRRGHGPGVDPAAWDGTSSKVSVDFANAGCAGNDSIRDRRTSARCASPATTSTATDLHGVGHGALGRRHGRDDHTRHAVQHVPHRDGGRHDVVDAERDGDRRGRQRLHTTAVNEVTPPADVEF